MHSFNTFLLLLLFGLFCCVAACQQSKGSLSIFAVEYGRSKFPRKQIFLDDKSPDSLQFAWLFYVLRFDGRVLLVDTGFSDKKLAKQYGVTHGNPLEILQKELAISPRDVTDIVLTHCHFDHIGNVPLFERARVYVHQDGLKTANAALLPKNDRLVTFSDEFEIEPWLKIQHIGGHTKESSVLWLEKDGNTFLFTGDEAYLLENIEKTRPLGFVHDKERNAQFLKEVKAMSNVKILTFHSPEHVPVGKNTALIYKSQ